MPGNGPASFLWSHLIVKLSQSTEDISRDCGFSYLYLRFWVSTVVVSSYHRFTVKIVTVEGFSYFPSSFACPWIPRPHRGVSLSLWSCSSSSSEMWLVIWYMDMACSLFPCSSLNLMQALCFLIFLPLSLWQETDFSLPLLDLGQKCSILGLECPIPPSGTANLYLIHLWAPGPTKVLSLLLSWGICLYSLP